MPTDTRDRTRAHPPIESLAPPEILPSWTRCACSSVVCAVQSCETIHRGLISLEGSEPQPAYQTCSSKIETRRLHESKGRGGGFRGENIWTTNRAWESLASAPSPHLFDRGQQQRDGLGRPARARSNKTVIAPLQKVTPVGLSRLFVPTFVTHELMYRMKNPGRNDPEQRYREDML